MLSATNIPFCDLQSIITLVIFSFYNIYSMSVCSWATFWDRWCLLQLSPFFSVHNWSSSLCTIIAPACMESSTLFFPGLSYQKLPMFQAYAFQFYSSIEYPFSDNYILSKQFKGMNDVISIEICVSTHMVHTPEVKTLWEICGNVLYCTRESTFLPPFVCGKLSYFYHLSSPCHFIFQL
jgi:hypothetical protein